MKCEVITITPQLAESILSTSNGNRGFKAAKVNQYARDMSSGKWTANGETIIIDVNGALIDGHHRLSACVKAGIPFETMVVWGAPIDANKTIDMGASRSSHDALSFYGYKNVTSASAIVRILMSLEYGRARSANPSTQEVFDFIDQNPGISAAAAFCDTHNKVPPGTRSMIGVIYFMASMDGMTTVAVRFADVLTTGLPAYPGCAAHALRERLIKNAISNAKLSPADRQLLILSAWEKFKVAAPVKTLKSKATFSVVGMTRKES